MVRDWCLSPRSPFVDLGRPTLFEPGERQGYTLDFALQPPDGAGIYVGEMKCELEFEKYRYLTLEREEQLDHHRSPAFRRFLELAADPHRYDLRVGGKPQNVLGTLLVWGAATDAGRAAVEEKYGVSQVLTVDDLLIDLHAWGNKTPWPKRVERLRKRSNSLFDELLGQPKPGPPGDGSPQSRT